MAISLEEMNAQLGEAPMAPTAKPKIFLAPKEISLEEMNGQLGDQTDYVSQEPIRSFGKGLVETAKGVAGPAAQLAMEMATHRAGGPAGKAAAKAVVSGFHAVGEAGAAGLEGGVTAIARGAQALVGGKPVGAALSAGWEEGTTRAAEAHQKVRELAAHIWAFDNADEVGKAEKFDRVMAAVPEACSALGSAGYEQFNSPLFGAAVDTTCNGLLLVLGSGLGRGEKAAVKGTPKAQAAVASTEAAFSELAVNNPVVAEKVTAQVAKTDPKLGARLRKVNNRFRNATEEELSKLGEDIALAKTRAEELTLEGEAKAEPAVATKEPVGNAWAIGEQHILSRDTGIWTSPDSGSQYIFEKQQDGTYHVRVAFSDGGGVVTTPVKPDEIGTFILQHEGKKVAAVEQPKAEGSLELPGPTTPTEQITPRQGAEAIRAMKLAVRDETPYYDMPGGTAAYNLFEAQNIANKPDGKLKRVSMNNSLSLVDDYTHTVNVDGKHYGVSKFEDPDATSDALDSHGDPKEFVWAYHDLEHPNKKMIETATSDPVELVEHIRKNRGSLELPGPVKDTFVDTIKETVYRAAYPEGHRAKEGRGTFFTTDRSTAERFNNRPGKTVEAYQVDTAGVFEYTDKDSVHELVNALGPKTIRERADLVDRISHGDWGLLEQPRVLKTIRELGYKGYTTQEFGPRNISLFGIDPIKLGDNLSSTLGELEAAVTRPEPPPELSGPKGGKTAGEKAEPETLNVVVKGTDLDSYWSGAHRSAMPMFLDIRKQLQQGTTYVAGREYGSPITPLLDGRVIDSHVMLKEILTTAPIGPVRDLIEHMVKTMDAVPVEFTTQKIVTAVGESDAPGIYLGEDFIAAHNDPKGRRIIIRLDDSTIGAGSGLTNVFVHEVFHANTVDFMRKFPNHPLTIKAKELYAAANELIPQVLDTLSSVREAHNWDPAKTPDLTKSTGGAVYGLKNVWEFLAEAHARPAFTRLLAEAARYDTGGLLNKFQAKLNQLVTVFSDMVGVKGEAAKLLHATWDVTDRIVAEQKKWMQNRIAEDRAAAAATSPVIYESGGIPVTREDVKAAFRLGADAARKIPGAKIAEGKLKGYWNELVRGFAPESLGPFAKQAGAILAESVAKEHILTSMRHGQATQRATYWNKMGDAEGLKFMMDYEKGVTFKDSIQEKASIGYHAWSKELAADEISRGLRVKPIDHYLYHSFKDGPGVVQYFNKLHGRKWGDPNFTKERSFELYEQALNAVNPRTRKKFEPKYTNPEELMLARQHAHDIAVTRIEMLEEFEKQGLAIRVKEGETVAPDGYSSNSRRSPNGKRYWINDEANAVMAKLYDTVSLWRTEGGAGDAFRGAMALKNKIVPLKLGLSLFHALHVATIDNATGMVRATKSLVSGTMTPVKWMAEMGKAAFYRDIYDNPKSGGYILSAVQGKLKANELTQMDKESIVLMTEGGFMPGMPKQHRMNSLANFKRAVERKSATAIWHAPWAAVDAIQGIMFEKWIPSLKIASYLKDVKTALETDPTLGTDLARRREAFRKISKSIDNRYGEMSYDTLFWDKRIKDIGVLSTLSLGWNLGFLREYGGGGIELGKAAWNEGGIKGKVSRGELDRALFVTYYSAQALLYGGLMTYLFTGKEPQEPLDYTFPKNGEKNPDGTDQRVSTMFYPREFVAIAKHAENEGMVSGLSRFVLNKTSPALGLLNDWWRGSNYFGEEIRDPNAPIATQLAQTLAFTFKSLEPISTTAMRKGAGDVTVKRAVMSVAGFTPAPKYITETKTEGAIKSTFQKYYGTPRTAYEKVEYSVDARELKELHQLHKNSEYQAKLREMVKEYDLTLEEKHKLTTTTKKGVDPFIRMFSRLTWQQQKRILDGMTKEERKNYLPHSNEAHLRRHYRAPEATQ